MYVLDRLRRPVPPGITGELYIAGGALAREYLGDPTLTAQKFVPAPWGDGERLYVSGDLVLRLDGASSDQPAWMGLLKTLREYRSRRPIDGALASGID